MTRAARKISLELPHRLTDADTSVEGSSPVTPVTLPASCNVRCDTTGSRAAAAGDADRACLRTVELLTDQMRSFAEETRRTRKSHAIMLARRESNATYREAAAAIGTTEQALYNVIRSDP